MTKEQSARIQKYAFHMKKHALYMALAAGEHASHFGAGMSIIDILAVLYSECLYYPQYGDAMWENRDRFILSKGHGVIGLYAALVEKGIISRDEIKNFEHNGTFLLGHPVQNLQHGVEFTSGSLGMGLSIGVGVALGAKRQNKKITTYVLVGDGECDEGAVWEATMAASHFRLDNLSLIIDKNGYQLGGFTKDVMNTDNLLLKFKSFGWKTIEIDGHNHQQLLSAFSHKANENQPTVIIANTKKGNGFSFSENSNNWHHAVLTEKQYREALQELEEAYDNY